MLLLLLLLLLLDVLVLLVVVIVVVVVERGRGRVDATANSSAKKYLADGGTEKETTGEVADDATGKGGATKEESSEVGAAVGVTSEAGAAKDKTGEHGATAKDRAGEDDAADDRTVEVGTVGEVGTAKDKGGDGGSTKAKTGEESAATRESPSAIGVNGCTSTNAAMGKVGSAMVSQSMAGRLAEVVRRVAARDRVTIRGGACYLLAGQCFLFLIANAIFGAAKNLARSRDLVRTVTYRLVCRPYHNRRYLLRQGSLPKIIRNLVHRRDYGLDADRFAQLLYDVFKISPPMALHLPSLIGLGDPRWIMGVIAYDGTPKGYAQEMQSAMLNFGHLEDRQLDAIVVDVAQKFIDCVAPDSDLEWTQKVSDYV
ncbi:hypothetical protein BC828DRAFT_440720 [Blastocladiella britannica]|nr:hypothetical protein BC828DRAFT_440720 [Blastocladiella britannica]